MSAAPRTPVRVRGSAPANQRDGPAHPPNILDEDQLIKRLQEFALKNPGHCITSAGLADALRQLAKKKKVQERDTYILGAFGSFDKALLPAPTFTSNTKSAKKRAAAATQDNDDVGGQDEKGGDVIRSPFKKICIDLEKGAHVPLGEYDVSSPPRRISAHADSPIVTVTPPAPIPRIQRFTPINKTRADDSDDDNGESIDEDATPKANSVGPLPNATLTGSPGMMVMPDVSPPMRRHGGSPSGATPSPSRIVALGGKIPTFSSATQAAGTNQRKTAPSPLNLEIPGAAPRKPINNATHYIAMQPFQKSLPKPNIEEIQKVFDNMPAIKANPNMRVTLLKTPIYNLEPGERTRSNSAWELKPVPQTPAVDLHSPFRNKLAPMEPRVKKFTAAAHRRNVAAAERALTRIAAQVGTPYATGNPQAYKVERRLTRADRALNAMKYGRGSSSGNSNLQHELRGLSLLRGQSGSAGSPSKLSCASSVGARDNTPFDLISALCRIPELATNIAIHLPPRDVLTLYSVSVQFHTQTNMFLQSSITFWCREWAPDAANVFRWNSPVMSTYFHFAIKDPVGRPLTKAGAASQTTEQQRKPILARDNRMVPSMKWYQMVALRDDVAIDILAHLARQGFRCPQGTKVSLLKMWMIMDLPTNEQRSRLLATPGLFSDQDLVNIVIVILKLTLLMHDPIYGPESAMTSTPDLLDLMLGQKSLYALWQMLFGHDFRDPVSLLRCKIRYDLGGDWQLGRTGTSLHRRLDPKYLRPNAKPVLGVPAHRIGRTQLEYWGENANLAPATTSILSQPPSLVMTEVARRQLRLHDHMLGLMLWGHTDPSTGRNLAPTEAEIWMRDSEHKNRMIDTRAEFDVFHCRRANWDTLTERERRRVLLAQEIREERVYAWDEHRYDDEKLTAPENVELNRHLRGLFLGNAGVDRSDRTFRVDENANEIPPVKNPYAGGATTMPGPTTTSFSRAREYARAANNANDDDNDSYDSDASVDSAEVQMAVNDDSKLAYVWKPDPEDHDLHVPRSAIDMLAEMRVSDSGESEQEEEEEEDSDDTNGEEVDGDVEIDFLVRTRYRSLQELWESMQPKVFKIISDSDSEHSYSDSDFDSLEDDSEVDD